jgi:hypothetical protein
MLGGNCSSCCNGCPACMPQSVTVDIGVAGWGWLDWNGWDANSSPVLEGFFQSLNYANSQATDSGKYASCSNSKCMRVTAARGNAFVAGTAGAYTLTRAPDCKSYNYANASACDSNKILAMSLVILQPDEVPEGYAPLPQRVYHPRNCSGLGFPGIYARKFPGAMEYRMTATVCLTGDEGSSRAAPCAAGPRNDPRADEIDIRRCPCAPTTISALTQFGNRYSGGCSYSGMACTNTFTFHSVGSIRSNSLPSPQWPQRVSWTLARAGAVYSPSTTVAPTYQDPRTGQYNNPSFKFGWCDRPMHFVVGGQTLPGSVADYQNAQCVRDTLDVWFPLLANTRLDHQVEVDNECCGVNSGLNYQEIYRESFCFGARLRMERP